MEQKKHPDIKTGAVKSSNIDAIGHEGTTLAVKFKSGGTYHYYGVSKEQFDGLHKAESIGKAMSGIKSSCKCCKIP